MIKVNVGGQAIQKDVKIAGTIAVYANHDGTLTDLGTPARLTWLDARAAEMPGTCPCSHTSAYRSG